MVALQFGAPTIYDLLWSIQITDCNHGSAGGESMGCTDSEGHEATGGARFPRHLASPGLQRLVRLTLSVATRQHADTGPIAPYTGAQERNSVTVVLLPLSSSHL